MSEQPVLENKEKNVISIENHANVLTRKLSTKNSTGGTIDTELLKNVTTAVFLKQQQKAQQPIQTTIDPIIEKKEKEKEIEEISLSSSSNNSTSTGNRSRSGSLKKILTPTTTLTESGSSNNIHHKDKKKKKSSKIKAPFGSNITIEEGSYIYTTTSSDDSYDDSSLLHKIPLSESETTSNLDGSDGNEKDTLLYRGISRSKLQPSSSQKSSIDDESSTIVDLKAQKKRFKKLMKAEKERVKEREKLREKEQDKEIEMTKKQKKNKIYDDTTVVTNSDLYKKLMTIHIDIKKMNENMNTLNHNNIEKYKSDLD